MKRGTWMFISVSLFLGAVTIAAAVPGIMEGFGGFVITVFMLYCALIVVAQLLSALYAVRHMMEETFEKKRRSSRVELR